ncbi:MAG: HAMP domain-containing histidine kinase [Elusimicrobia bacterium]|nr:HAMP domain-containing histidine kinase [Elusimicrobiota bacterium]
MATDLEEGGIDLAAMTSLIRHEVANPMAVIGNSAYFVKNRLTAKPSADEKAVALLQAMESEVHAATATLKSIRPELKLQAAVAKAMELDSSLKSIEGSLTSLKPRVEGKPPADEKVAKHLNIIGMEIQRAYGILQAIDFYFKLKSLSPQTADLDLFLDEVLSGHPFPAGVKLKKSLQSKARVSMERPRLARALKHLLDNCAEAMPSGGTVTVSSKTEKGQAVVEVQDSGPGFSPEALVKAFTPFFTTRERKLGLSLATVKKIMTLHKGTARVMKSSGGAVVRLSLPVA